MQTTTYVLNDCLLESENIQITKKDNKYLLQPTSAKTENMQKFVLKECGKFLKKLRQIYPYFHHFSLFLPKSHSSGIHFYFLMSGTEREGKRICDDRKEWQEKGC